MNDERIFELLGQHPGPAKVATDFADALFDQLQGERRRRPGWLAHWMGSLALARRNARRLAFLVAVLALLLAATVIGLALSSLLRTPQATLAYVDHNDTCWQSHPDGPCQLTSSLVIVTDDGREHRLFTGGATESPIAALTWSADGRRLAFVRREGDQSVVYAARADGSGLRALYRMPGPGLAAQIGPWSPDEESLLVWAETAGGTMSRGPLVYLNAGTGETRVLAANVSLEENEDATWSPDGRWVTYSSHREASSGGESVRDVWIVATQQPTRPPFSVLTDSGTQLVELQWSPDNNWIAYRADQALWLAEADGSGQHELIHGLRPGPFFWAPDSRAIVTAGPPTGGQTLDIVDLAGRTVHTSPEVDGHRPYWINLVGIASRGELVWEARSGSWHALGATSLTDLSSRVLGPVTWNRSSHPILSRGGKTVSWETAPDMAEPTCRQSRADQLTFFHTYDLASGTIESRCTRGTPVWRGAEVTRWEWGFLFGGGPNRSTFTGETWIFDPVAETWTEWTK